MGKSAERMAAETVAKMVLRAYPMPKADPNKKMDLSRLYMVNINHPLVKELYEDFKRAEGIPPYCPCSDFERILFEVQLLSSVRANIKEKCLIRLKEMVSEKWECDKQERTLVKDNCHEAAAPLKNSGY